MECTLLTADCKRNTALLFRLLACLFKGKRNTFLFGIPLVLMVRRHTGSQMGYIHPPTSFVIISPSARQVLKLRYKYSKDGTPGLRETTRNTIYQRL